jgi:hypothetical protein
MSWLASSASFSGAAKSPSQSSSESFNNVDQPLEGCRDA